jgi:FemAB-related protein (PEP-CTERM system-associated)
MRIARTDEADAQRWDEYVGPRTGTVTDLFAWRLVVQRAYGLRSHFLTSVEGNRIVGALGLFEVEHPIFGHYLTTAVFGNDGGFHFDNPPARDALLAEGQRLTQAVNADYLAIRSRTETLHGFRDDDRYRTAVIDLEGGAEGVWNRLPAKTRNQIRRGQKEGFTVQTGPDQLDDFHAVFHRHMRDLGSPAHSRAFYRAVVEHLGERAEFIVVRDGRELVGGALLFRHNVTATNYHTVALHKFNRRCPNYLLYWAMIESSCARGDRWFDMGRSMADSSTLSFKGNWSPAIVPLHYNYFLGRAKEIPNLNPANPVFRLQIAAWRRLPLFVTKFLGPRLISGLA